MRGTWVPVLGYSTVAGIPVTELIAKDKLDAIIAYLRATAAAGDQAAPTGSAYYAPSASVVAMVESILLDKKRILPCAISANGEYGIKGLFVGLPVVLGRKGIEKIIEMKLNPEERPCPLDGHGRDPETLRERR